MKHYSIMATDIYINQIHNETGWSLGDPLHFEVNNCEWKSRLKVFLSAHGAQHNELIVQPYFLSGNRDKMINDSLSLSIALQSHLGPEYNINIQEII